jgi:hypothetical protein
MIGCEETAAAIYTALALRQCRRAEVAIDGILANPQLLGHGPPGPPLLVKAPDPLMERPPLRLALLGQLLDHPGGRWRWHQDGHRIVEPRHRRPTEGLIDGREGVAMGASQCLSRCVRRAPGATSGVSRSVNRRRGQRPLAQQNFRTRKWSTTRHGPQGSSATVRTSRLWMRRVGNRQTGQWTRACIDVSRKVSWVVVSSMCQASRWSRDTSGSKRGKSVTDTHSLH